MIDAAVWVASLICFSESTVSASSCMFFVDRVDALAAKLCGTTMLCNLDLIRYLRGRHCVNTMLSLASIRSLCAGYVAATTASIMLRFHFVL